jgi:hypothetical protein
MSLSPAVLTGSWSIEVAPDHNDRHIRFFGYNPEGKAVKNHPHPDVTTSDREAEIDRLLVPGATRLRDIPEDGNRWTAFADPEDDEFELIAG